MADPEIFFRWGRSPIFAINFLVLNIYRMGLIVLSKRNLDFPEGSIFCPVVGGGLFLCKPILK